ETPMNPQKAQRLVQLTNQMAEMLMTVARCANDVRTEVQAEFDGDAAMPGQRVGGRSSTSVLRVTQRPILDQSTLCVVWKGKSAHLGNTLAFRLLERLSCCPN